jgi:glycosyltransferase involved in cell wall biosynthesis
VSPALTPLPCVTAIVPIYNEQSTVARVVEAVLASGLVAEVICVNDGSTDRSLDVLRGFGDRIVLRDLERNGGKGHALAEGVRAASGEIVVFLDADLANLSREHLSALLEPVAGRRADAARGIAGADLIYSALDSIASGAASIVGSQFTGMRAYRRRDLIVHLPAMDQCRFGVEAYLNDAYRGATVEVVTLRGLVALGKHEKHGWRVAAREYAVEVVEVSRILARTGVARLAS